MICQCKNPDPYLDYEQSVMDKAQKFCLTCDGKIIDNNIVKVKQEITAESFTHLQSCVEGELNPNDYDIVEEVLLSKVSKNEFVKLKPNAKKIYLRGSYVQEGKTYELIGHNCDDVIYRNGGRKVIIGFTY